MTKGIDQNAFYPIAHHVDLRPLGEGRCLIQTPSGEAYELDATPETIGALLARCDGARSLDQVVAGLDNEASMCEVLNVLREEGCLLNGVSAREPLKRFHVHLIGDAALCLEAERMCGSWGSVTYHATETPAEMDDPADAVLVALNRYIDGDWLRALDRYCTDRGLRWTQLHFDLGRGFLGPFMMPGRTSSYEDLLDRRRCSGDDVEGAQMRRPLLPAEGAPRAPVTPAGPTIRWMLAMLFRQVEKAVLDEGCGLFSTEWEVEPETLSLSPHRVLPLPTRVPEQWLCSDCSAYEMVVDQRCGVVLSQHAVDHHESLPANLITIRSHCTDLSRIYPWGNDLFVGGSTFGDAFSARGASLGEALERYCGNCLPGVATVHASYDELLDEGRRALDPERLILHSRKMIETPGCPFTAFTRDLKVHWVAGHSMTRDEACLLPLSLVYANWMGGELNQPITNYLYTPGMAAGENPERALVGAVRELVERDITMAWWLNAHPLPSIKPTPALEALWRDVPDRELQKVRYIHLDNPFNIPVIVAVVEHTAERFLNIGFGCRPDPEEAARKALTEALTLQEGSRDLAQRDSTLRRSSEDWNLLSVKYRPWREDRSYVDAFRPDFRDVDDLMLQQQYFLDPRAVERVRPLVDPPQTRRFDELPRLADDSLAAYRGPIEKAGFELLYADITSPDIALTGYRVVRAIIPGLIPNMPAAFPAVGGERVFQLPVEMGWRETPLTEEELNYHPMPHA